jgi:putative ABC transport system permease protein
MGERLRRLGFLFRRKQFDRELDEELRFHVEERARALEDEGLTPAAARARAGRELGGALRTRERAESVWTIRWWDALRQDLRYALRGLWRSPTFALAVIATLAIGIGATSAIFTLVDRVLLRPLPYDDPDQLALIVASKPDANQPRIPLSFPNFSDTRDRARSFSGLAAWTLGEVNLVGIAGPEQVQYGLVTSNFFDVLGVSPVLGRRFRPDEDRRGTAPVVLLSHGLWQRRFGGDRAIVGRRLQLEDRAHEIVGVLPQGFEFATFPARTELWLPFGLDRFEGRPFARGANALGAIGRLGPGVTMTAAQAELDTIAAALAREEPFFNRGRFMHASPLVEQASAGVRAALLVLSVSVGVLLLVACVNVVNLLLARSAARQRELAVRAALGAGRRRLAFQLLVEHLVLALIGGVAATGPAAASTGLLAGLPYNAPDLFTPYVAPLDALGIDGRALVFTLTATAVTGLIVGLGPALRGARLSGRHDLVSGGRITSDRQALRVRGLLVGAEVALSVVLLATMAVMLASLVKLQRTSPGFEPDGLLTAELRLPASKYGDPTRAAAFYDGLLARLRAMPGVLHAAAGEAVPFTGPAQSTSFYVEGRQPPPPDRRTHVHYRSVTDDYVETLGMRLVEGRTFTARDDGRAARVAMVNETLARQVFGGERAIGRRLAIDLEAMRFFRDRAPELDVAAGLREIVGIVGDVRQAGLGAPAAPELYIPAAQRVVRGHTLVVRGRGDPLALVGSVRAAVASLDADQPLTHVESMAGLVSASLVRPRFNTGLLVAFGLVALALAAVGIYGVTAYAVSQHTRDLGVHMALGATPRDVLALVFGRSAVVVAGGLAAGLAGAIAASRLLQRALADVEPVSPLALVTVAIVVVVVAAVATFVPARRAQRIDPVAALRAD